MCLSIVSIWLWATVVGSRRLSRIAIEVIAERFAGKWNTTVVLLDSLVPKMLELEMLDRVCACPGFLFPISSTIDQIYS